MWAVAGAMAREVLVTEAAAAEETARVAMAWVVVANWLAPAAREPAAAEERVPESVVVAAPRQRRRGEKVEEAHGAELRWASAAGLAWRSGPILMCGCRGLLRGCSPCLLARLTSSFQWRGRFFARSCLRRAELIDGLKCKAHLGIDLILPCVVAVGLWRLRRRGGDAL